MGFCLYTSSLHAEDCQYSALLWDGYDRYNAVKENGLSL